jgi:methionyl aminopeptidase
MTITYKDAAGIAGMRVAGQLASEVLDYLTPFVQAGVSTNALDQLAHDYIVQVQGGIPAPLSTWAWGKDATPCTWPSKAGR